MIRKNNNLLSMENLLKAMKLPSILEHYQEIVDFAEREKWEYNRFLKELLEIELEGRIKRKLERLLKQSFLPKEKNLSSFDLSCMPSKIKRIVPELCTGKFVERAENVLAFGLPGRGKTHLVCAIGHELIKKSIPVLFLSTQKLVSQLLRAKRDYELDVAIKKLDRFPVIILDDIGYVKQNREEMEVLFTFLSERYERKSVMITSNLVFSQWEQIFKDPLTTAAAIDRLVHHSFILEIPETVKSFRMNEACQRLEIDILNHENEIETGHETNK
ncbi:MAG: IstB ATP binding domain-containing protein [Candidatus Magnetoglobus multicellularis str. Araruama]|uniref:IstB ATP binding domain-containing protein n=1 Tax=Candidatus Magnetoglobus multicellularis str. Araruama TaxID=890399 RepID=A0A1V1NZ45_9BACT|nr:MAG: IstB ATP binding domain-containing protein [Candidatus Magnetoglobus multicellularis str. Araruama]